MFKNIANNLVTVIVGLVTPLVIIPILTSQLGLNEYGIYVKDIAYSALICVLLDIGFGMYIPKQIAMSSIKDQEKIISLYIRVKILLLPIVVIFIFFEQGNYSDYALVLLIYALFSYLDFSIILVGLERYSILARFTLISKLAFLLVVICIDFGTNGLFKIMLVQAILKVITSVFFIFYLSKTHKLFTKCSLNEVFVFSKSAKDFYFARILTNIYQQSSTYLVAIFFKSDVVATYSIGVQIYKVGQSVIAAVSKVLYTSTSKTKDFSKLWLITKYSIAIYFLFVPVVFIYSRDILSLIFDFDVTELTTIIPTLYASLLFVILSSYWGYPALTPIGREKYAHYGIFFSSISYFLAFFSLITLNGIIEPLIGAIYCIVCAEVAGAIFRVYYANKFIDINKLRQS